jgi:hypothetical protein
MARTVNEVMTADPRTVDIVVRAVADGRDPGHRGASGRARVSDGPAPD